MSMKLLKSVSIRVKLTASFLIILVFVISTGIIASSSVYSVSKNGEDMYSYNLKSIDMLHQIKENNIQVKAYLLEAVYAQDFSTTNKVVPLINNLNTKNKLLMAGYEQNLLKADNKKAWEAYKDELTKYSTSRDEIIKFVSQGNNAMAKGLLEDFEASRVTMQDQLDKLVGSNQKVAENKNKENKSSVAKVSFSTILITVVGGIVAIGLGLII